MNDEQSVRKAIPVQGWKIRFDAPPRGGDSRRADRGNILAMFRAWNGANREEPDRRRTPRYTPSETRAWVGWWRGGHFLVSRAELVNLSEGGARVRLAQQPPTAVPVWVCIGSPQPTDYLQARILETQSIPDPHAGAAAVIGTRTDPGTAPGDSPGLGGALPYVSRLAFHSPCPSSFFGAAGRLAEESPAD